MSKVRVFTSNWWFFFFLKSNIKSKKSFLNQTIYVLNKILVVGTIFLKLRFFLKLQFLKSRFYCTMYSNMTSVIFSIFFLFFSQFLKYFSSFEKPFKYSNFNIFFTIQSFFHYYFYTSTGLTFKSSLYIKTCNFEPCYVIKSVFWEENINKTL